MKTLEQNLLIHLESMNQINNSIQKLKTESIKNYQKIAINLREKLNFLISQAADLDLTIDDIDILFNYSLREISEDGRLTYVHIENNILHANFQYYFRCETNDYEIEIPIKYLSDNWQQEMINDLLNIKQQQADDDLNIKNKEYLLYQELKNKYEPELGE